MPKEEELHDLSEVIIFEHIFYSSLSIYCYMHVWFEKYFTLGRDFTSAPGDAQLNFIRELLRKEKKCTQKCGTGIGDVRVWCEISKSEQECRKRNGCRADIRMDGVPNGRPSSRKRCRSRRRRVKEAGTWSSWQEW